MSMEKTIEKKSLADIRKEVLKNFSGFNYTRYYLRIAIFSLLFFSVSYITLLSANTLGWSFFVIGTIGLFLSFHMIAFFIMHGASHNLARNKKVSSFFLLISSVILDINTFRWADKHKKIHHPYNGMGDKDIDIQYQAGCLRLSEKQSLKKMHRFQHIYYLPILGFPIFFEKFFYGFKKSLVFPDEKRDIKKVIATKLVHYALFVFFPLFAYSFYAVLIYYLLFNFVTGFFVYLLLIIGHAKSEVLYGEEEKKYDSLTRQLLCTTNFSADSWFFTMLTNGVNLHVEHHLLPSEPIPMLKAMRKLLLLHYPETYHSYPTVFSAVYDQLCFLKRLGREPKCSFDV